MSLFGSAKKKKEKKSNFKLKDRAYKEHIKNSRTEVFFCVLQN